MKSLVLFFRKPVPHFFSIEKVFLSVAEQLDQQLDIKKSFLPHYTSSIRKILSNLIFARRQKGDVYHVTGDVHYVVLGLPRKRVVLTIHDCVYLHQYSGIKKWFFHSLFLKWPVRYSKVITTISEQSKREIIQFTNCPEAKIRVINNPVTTAIYFRGKEFNKGKPILLFLGSTPNKNLPRSIEAIKNISCKLHVIGIIPEEQEKMLSEYRIDYSKSVGLTEDQLAQAYAECDILLFPTLYEGFGLPILEGQTAGRPVLTSNQSPMKEVAGKGACLVNPTDVQSIRNGLKRIIEDEVYRSQIVQKGFENVRRFEPGPIAAQYLALYQEVINGLS
jgi:glycosyltransferase involved in cell wall biosynthesis